MAIDQTDEAEMRFYNGFSIAEMGDPYGLKMLGAEKLHPIVARGVLLDFAGLRGVDSMAAGECATVDDVRPGGARAAGDGRFRVRRGGRHPAALRVGEPLGRSGHVQQQPARDLHGRGALDRDGGQSRRDRRRRLGGDGSGAYPDEPGCAFCLHQYLQTRHGILNQENLALKQLADAGVYVITYIYSPMPITGATGSAGSPTAID